MTTLTLTLFNFSGRLQSAGSVYLTPSLIHVPIRSVLSAIRTKNNNSIVTIAILCPKNVSESYGFSYVFLLVCVYCKMLFTSSVWCWFISSSGSVAKFCLRMWVVSSLSKANSQKYGIYGKQVGVGHQDLSCKSSQSYDQIGRAHV